MYFVRNMYRGADKSLSRPGRKQATATEGFEFHISPFITLIGGILVPYIYIYIYIVLRFLQFYIYIYIYTGCPRRNVPNFGRVFLMLKYTDITQNTYVQS